MIIRDATFVASFQNEKSCPKDGLPEFAFIGRSNVGKSSLINMLCDKKGLAKVSNTPGKTQLINFFNINGSWFLVDLPGYGYARTSKTTKAGFQKMIEDYLLKRENLVTAFILLDIRHDLQKIDLEFINWLGEKQVPFNLVFTKSDKLGKVKVVENANKILNSLLEYWHELPRHFITSSETKAGREELLEYIQELLEMIQKNEH